MSLEVFRLVLDHLPPADILILQGIGEPVLHPQLRELVTLAKSRGQFNNIAFNTNALSRHVGYYVELSQRGLNHLSISVDSLNQSIADRCRFGTKVEKLKKRIAALYQALDIPMMISIVLSRHNLYDLPNTLFELSQLGKFSVEIQPLMLYHGIPDTEDTSHLLRSQDLETFRRFFPILTHDFASSLVLLPAGPFWPPEKRGRCPRPFVSPYITVDGWLTPCCTIVDPGVWQKNSILTQDFSHAWQSAPIQSWLQSYLSTQPEVCQGCTFNTDGWASS